MTDLAVAYCYSGRSGMVVALVGIVIAELIKKGKKPHIEGIVYNGKKNREEKHTMGSRSRCVSRPTCGVTAIVATAAAVVERLVMMVSGGGRSHCSVYVAVV